jgi:glycosyltransferase involved in cell wall biosynthesis
LDRSRFKPLFLALRARDWHEDLRRLGVEVITLDAAGRWRSADTPVDENATASSTRRSERPRLPDRIAWSFGLGRDIYQLVRLFRMAKFDLLHSNHAGAEPAPIAARIAGVRRLIATWHVDANYDLFGERQSFRYKALERVSMRSLHHAISVSEATKQNWVERCGLDEAYQSRISVIHNGISAGEWERRRPSEAAKASLGIEAASSVIGSIGRLDHAKGYHFLVEAFAAIVNRSPSTRLVIAGTGPLEIELKALAHRLGISDAILFTGFVRDVRSVLESFDVYAQPSLCEAHGFALLEAGGMGLPIVASGAGGNAETVRDGESGYIVPAKDAAALVPPLLRLIGDPSLRRQMGMAGQVRVKTRFTVEQMCDKTAAVYERVAHGL